MTLFFIFGLKLEKITSIKMLFSLYFLAGFIGSLVIVPVAILIGTEDLIAGASAAVFGIVTAFAVMRPDTLILRSKAKWWALSLFIFNVIIALLNPQTSDGAAAHVAGIIVGLIFGYWIKNKESEEPK
jgi:membrane associated rhomboid family serine protease